MTLIGKNSNLLPLFNILNGELQEHACTDKCAYAPAINIKENEAGYEVEVAAPGLTKGDFSIHIDEDDNLVINVEKEVKNVEENENNETRFIRREFGYSKFTEALSLPDNVDKEQITAKMEHGVLVVSLPKISEEELKKAQRQIEIL